MATSLDQLQQRCAQFNSILELPDFETSPEALADLAESAIQTTDAALDRIGAATSENRLTYKDTLQALDSASFSLGLACARIHLLKEVSPHADMRKAATEATKRLDEWAIGIDYREDVFLALRNFAETQPSLTPEQDKALSETLRDYRRIGLELPTEQRQEVERLRKRLTDLETDFQTHINEARSEIALSVEDAGGLPESFLDAPGVRAEDGSIRLRPNLTWHAMIVMERADSPEVRRRFLVARLSLAKDVNGQLLNEILEIRHKIAQALGYSSWSDFKIEPKMAKTSDNVNAFLDELVVGLETKFRAELEALRELKVLDTQDPDAQIELSDFRYYENRHHQREFGIDSEALRKYFPVQATLNGMFAAFERLFDLTIEELENPQPWAEGVTLYGVSDGGAGEPLGAFYLDLYPREGKFNHFAQFGLIPGKRRDDGRYQRPVVALIVNFPPPSDDAPSLLSHNETVTLYHEFGHALHSILTRAETARFSGTGVDRDFVEVPSQLAEYWAWDPSALAQFARDFHPPHEPIPEEIVHNLKRAEKATSGLRYRRQASFALADLALHRQRENLKSIDAIRETNEILSEVFLPHPEGSAFAAYFGHLCGYDAGYYGYLWSEAIAADINQRFVECASGRDDTTQGKRLREWIYAPGGSKEADELVHGFLEREPSLQPFLEELGVGKLANSDAAD